MIHIAGAVALTSGVSQGTGSIWLDEVHCSGSEFQLANCRANPIGVHNCDHSEDAGVRCSSSSLRGGISITPRAYRLPKKGRRWQGMHIHEHMMCSVLTFLAHAYS